MLDLQIAASIRHRSKIAKVFAIDYGEGFR